MRWEDLVPSKKEQSFVLFACTSFRRQRGTVAEWSACLPADHEVVASTPASAELFLLFSDRGIVTKT